MQTIKEFVTDAPLPRDGFTSVAATHFLQQIFPDEAAWTCWIPDHDLVNQITGAALTNEGDIGEWKWARVKCSYPVVHYRDTGLGRMLRSSGQDDLNWTGILRITSPRREQFLIFSFLTSRGTVGDFYLVSTADGDLLARFSRAVFERYRDEDTDHKIEIDVINGRNLYLSPESDEKIFLPPMLKIDVEQQVMAFFKDQKAFVSFNVPRRRGFLFVGPPGGGKTMMIRNLVRLCHAQFKLRFWTLNITQKTDEDEVVQLFERASRMAPGLVILEDLDSLTKDAHVSRAALLAQLDGLKPREGLLVIGTTNNPQDVDPALIHRPSRFDRVWLFETPDRSLRHQYLESSLKMAEPELLVEIAEKTNDWSFAYLNELRTTAAILAIQEEKAAIEGRHIRQAFKLLTAQFKSGQKGHTPTKNEQLGFEAE